MSSRSAGPGSPAPLLVMIAAAGLFVAGPGDAAQSARRGGERQRAKPPAREWDKTSKSAFFDDAFTSLEGERPDFVASAASKASAGSPGGAAGGATPGGFRWSTLVSPDTLADEIKEQRKAVAAVCRYGQALGRELGEPEDHYEETNAAGWDLVGDTWTAAEQLFKS